MVVPAAIRRELERHADEEAPNEACGLIAFRDGVAERYLAVRQRRGEPVPLRAAAARPDWTSISRTTGYELAVFHSHPTDSAEPSRTDIANIGLWEGRPYLILSRPTGELLAWTIASGSGRAAPAVVVVPRAT